LKINITNLLVTETQLFAA